MHAIYDYAPSSSTLHTTGHVSVNLRSTALCLRRPRAGVDSSKNETPVVYARLWKGEDGTGGTK